MPGLFALTPRGGRWWDGARIKYHLVRSPPRRDMSFRGFHIALPLAALCLGLQARAADRTAVSDPAHPVEDYSAAAAMNKLVFDDFARDLYPRGRTAQPRAVAASPKVQGQRAPTASISNGAASQEDAQARAAAVVVATQPPGQEHTLDLSVRLPGVTVNGRRDVFSESDRQLHALEASLPCAGCDGHRHDDPPRLVQIGTAVAIAAARSLLFSQPRVRGEPNDEALYLSHDGVCTPDDPFRCLNRPQLP